ncbi:MAG: hypothetical protein JXR56_04980 [Candidatus Cloacimonetes bacterium]|nr:hypothetical protein [Candidatus Cloacimonadota bacterium]
MNLAVDLHSHSGHAGGVGDIPLKSVSQTMKTKGIQVFGTGDVIFPTRTKELWGQLQEMKEGLFSLPNDDSLFALQTEIILSVKLKGYKQKIMAHHVVLFPNFMSVERMQCLMHKWGQKNTIGRPFIVSEDMQEQSDRLFGIKAIHPLVEIIPAHVMTPDGILGSKNNLSSISEFYGEFISEIDVIETGLSADPFMLEQVPELANKTMISNSDCHSAALNRIGREFTMLNVEEISYREIIYALRRNNVAFTAEFNPGEGRYYSTGHRADRPGHSEAYISSKQDETICPVCNKPFLPGVERRIKQLAGDYKAKHTRKFHHLLPLVEAVALTLGVKSITTAKVAKIMNIILSIWGTEINFWLSPIGEIEQKLGNILDDNIIEALVKIHRGSFTFGPAGFDGEYGVLKLI